MKRDSWRGDASAYPFQMTLAPRWSDVDTLRHLNNVALQGLHLEVRQCWIAQTLGLQGTLAGEPELRPLWLATDFLAQAHYPAPLLACARLTTVGEAHFELATGLFQTGRCVGQQSSRMAVWKDGLPSPLPAELAAALRGAIDRAPAQATLACTEPDLAHVPPQWHSATMRFADLDAHHGIGELALARMAEQTRVHLMEQVLPHYRRDPLGPRFLVAHMQMLPLRKASSVGPGWTFGAGQVDLGRSSMRLRSWMRDPREQTVAVADTVLVCTDLDTQLPVSMGKELRELMLDLTVRPLGQGTS